MRYLPLTDSDRQAMLRTIGAASIDDLFVDVPEAARLTGPIAGLPNHASELAVERHMARLAKQNLSAGEAPFFLGAGAYKHHIPASVDHLIQRGEFLTSYTPYQPEIAQGTLQALIEFQTQVARLLGWNREFVDDETVDVLIVGGGPAGVAAGVKSADERADAWLEQAGPNRDEDEAQVEGR